MTYVRTRNSEDTYMHGDLDRHVSDTYYCSNLGIILVARGSPRKASGARVVSNATVLILLQLTSRTGVTRQPPSKILTSHPRQLWLRHQFRKLTSSLTSVFIKLPNAWTCSGCQQKHKKNSFVLEIHPIYNPPSPPKFHFNPPPRPPLEKTKHEKQVLPASTV